jgi:hypothetical protein
MIKFNEGLEMKVVAVIEDSYKIGMDSIDIAEVLYGIFKDEEIFEALQYPQETFDKQLLFVMSDMIPGAKKVDDMQYIDYQEWLDIRIVEYIDLIELKRKQQEEAI